ncbi:MAG: acyl-ACP--UDP-N-acetylglucosamine O-acyltransferase [bacterium]|nr:acyl-ACP--UDP-N-acetylglucosamine O-acyltransferase [bacterium]
MEIHPTAIVHPKAKIADDVQIGPFSIVEENVTIGQGTKIGSHIILNGWTTIGKNCTIHMGCVIGHEPQIKNYEEKESYVVIGDNNIIREYVTIHRGWKEGETTNIGNDNYIMANAHVGHNCQIGSGVIITNSALLAGHVIVEDKAIISGLVGIHQFCRIGAFAMLGGMSAIVQDVPPYMLVDGNPAVVHGINTVGLRRAGFSQELRHHLKTAYKILYRSNLNTSQSLAKIEKELPSLPEINHLIEFIKKSKRGICCGKGEN